MSSPLLDFKKFTHVKSDDTSTTLKHKDGHILNIMHNALSKPNQEQLKAMSKLPANTDEGSQKEAPKSEYGKVKIKDDEQKPSNGKVTVKEEPKQPIGKVKVKLAEGSDDLKYSEGTEPKYGDSNTDTKYGKSDTDTRYAKGGNVCMHCGGSMPKYAEGTPELLKRPEESPDAVESAVDTAGTSFPRTSETLPSDLTGFEKMIGKPYSNMSDVNPDAALGSPGSKYGPQAQKPQDQAQPSSAPQTHQSPQEDAPQAPAEQETDQQASEPASANAPDTAKPPQALPERTPAQIAQELKQDTMAHQQDYNLGEIKPETYNQYFNDHGLGHKISSMFAMILGGMGAGLTGGPNVALGMINKMIDNDFEAQKTNRTNAMNFIKLGQQKTVNEANIARLVKEGKLTDAQARNELIKGNIEGFAWGQMNHNQAAFNKIAEAAKKYKGTPNEAAADQLLAMATPMMNEKTANIADLAAGQIALMNMNGMQQSQPALGPVNYNRFNKLDMMSKRKIPGAPSEVDIQNMTHEAKGLDEATALKTDFDKTFQELDSKFLADKLSPNDRKSAIDSLKGKLAKVAEGRFTAQSGQLIDAMLPQAADWGKTRQNKKERDERFFDILKSGTPTLTRYGVINPPQQQSGVGAFKEGQRGIQKSTGRPTIFSNGVWKIQ